MHYLNFLYPTLLATSAFFSTGEALRSDANKKVKLSQVQSLTLRKDKMTSHRRVSAIPQLKCISGSGCPHYQIDILRCKNSGSDYSSEDIQWTCTASLPPEFKLGATDVICEGYDSPDDPYILKGSCGVEYRLLLTEKGEEKYGRKGWWGGGDNDDAGRGGEGESLLGEKVANMIFWVIFVGVAVWIAYSALTAYLRGPTTLGTAPGGRPGWGGGGGGGGGGGWYPGGNDDDPPPPYDWRPSSNPKRTYGTTRDQSWRPGFWSGALGGAAAGYMAGNRGRSNRTDRANEGLWGGGSGGRQSGSGGGSSWFNNGEGSSRSGSSGSSSGGSSARYESTGFGSTARR
ncbi:DUF1183-domain-containing protein [Delitschia confertaspora ATCC 74209]|uniref:Store-operated calcium entry-associated regulatory factor n=1 Tax=Delitschia confertaspora ATCC 74209 TaxID=1513339 RepID=A0A9P4JH19_9PLEO|nr:DUF1183-domain-containing protein [Delitschia confertaspora ATCC 74209]